MFKLLVTAGVLALCYFGLVLLAYFFQRQMIYYPSQFSESDLIREAATSGLEPWRNARGDLIGWKALASPAEPGGPHPMPQVKARLVVFHGNANHAHWCDYYAKALQSNLQPHRWDVYLLEYPGYASRPGSPGEEALVEAGLESVDELKQLSNQPIFLLGESIGAGVAAQVASKRPDDVAGLFFIAPPNNLADVGASHVPILPVRWLLKDTYRSDEALKKFHGPLAVMIGGQDEIVPNRLSQKLFDDYSGPKKLWQQPFASHNTFNFDEREPFWKEVGEFLLQNSAPRTQKSE